MYIIDVRGGGRRLLLYSYVTSSIVCSIFLFYFIIFTFLFTPSLLLAKGGESKSIVEGNMKNVFFFVLFYFLSLF